MELYWTREPSRGKHGIYLVHDDIYYCTVRLRDSQEEGEKNKEENNRECTNKKQQRRRKGHATPNTQDSPSEEDIHKEGARAQRTRRTYTKKRTRCEPQSRPVAYMTKQIKKDKRISEKHGALCEAEPEHRKTIQKN
jgi:hypothetical protein